MIAVQVYSVPRLLLRKPLRCVCSAVLACLGRWREKTGWTAYLYMYLAQSRYQRHLQTTFIFPSRTAIATDSAKHPYHSSDRNRASAVRQSCSPSQHCSCLSHCRVSTEIPWQTRRCHLPQPPEQPPNSSESRAHLSTPTTPPHRTAAQQLRERNQLLHHRHHHRHHHFRNCPSPASRSSSASAPDSLRSLTLASGLWIYSSSSCDLQLHHLTDAPVTF